MRRATVVFGMLTFATAAIATRASAQAGDSYKVQPPELASPARASLAGSLSHLALGAGDVRRGSLTLPSPYSAPEDRGPLLAKVFPTYSAEGGISEWGMGWRTELALTRWRPSGTIDYATDDLNGPFGHCKRAADGNWYPVGLGTLVRIESAGAGFVAYTSDGAKWRFGQVARIDTRAGAARSGTYAWYLDEVETVTGRKASLSYSRNPSGRLFLSQVDFGGVGSAFEHRVTIEYAATSKAFVDYRSGMALALDRYVSSVKVWSRHAVTRAWQVRSEFTPSYRFDDVGPAFYLAGVQQTFAGGARAPALSYTYELSSDVLAAASLERSPKFDRVLAAFGPEVLLPDASTLVDVNADGLLDVELASDNSLLTQGASGFTLATLPPLDANTSPECRLSPSPLNRSRPLAAMRAGSDDVQVVAVRPGLTTSQVVLCDRGGTPVFEATVPGSWTLGPATRLVDLNSDHQPDLIQVFSGGYAVIPNLSTPARYALGELVTGELNLGYAFNGVWLQDFNGDGLPDLVTAADGFIGVYFNKGNFAFERDPAVYETRNWDGVAFDASEFQFTWVDADHDGMIDLLLSNSAAAYLLRNTGDAFVAVLIGGNYDVSAGLTLPLFSDLSGSGNAEVFFVIDGQGYALALSSPATGLLKTADDGKGTRLTFTWDRAAPAPGLRSRHAVLKSVLSESSGQGAFTTSYDYAAPTSHSTGQYLVGFDRVTATTPTGWEAVTFLNGDDFSGLLASSLKRDVNAPRADAFERRDYADVSFQGLPWKRLESERSGFQDPSGAATVAEQTAYAYASPDAFCPETVTRTTASGVLTTTKAYSQPASYGNALSCLWTTAVEQGSHADHALDFTHTTVLTRNAAGLVEKVESVDGAEHLVLQTATYRPDWLLESVSSPGRGTSTFGYDPATLVLSSVTTPDGVLVEAVDRDPLHDGIRTLKSTRGSVSFQQYFRFDGQERLQSAWDDLGASTELNPVTRFSYQFATALEPAAVFRSELVDTARASARDAVDLLDAAGASVATASRVPQGWAFGPVTTRSRAAAQTKRWLRPSLGTSANPMALDYGSLLSGANQVASGIASVHGHDAESRTTFGAGVERVVTRSLSLSGGLLQLTATENGTVSTNAWMDAGKRILAWDDEDGVRYGYTYDALGRVREVALPDGNRHRARYDGHGRIWRVERDGVASVEYGFDPTTGILTTKRFYTSGRARPANALVRTVAYAHDGIGRVKTETQTLADGGPSKRFTYHYDGATPADPAARSTLGLATGVTGDGYSKTLEYRADGKLKRRVIALGTWRTVETTFDYLEGGTVGGRTVRVYDALGTLLSTSALTYDHDGYGRLGAVKLNGDALATLSYDANGLLSGATFANGDALTLSHDDLTRRPTGSAQVTAGYSASTTVALNSRGLVESETFAAGSTSVARTYGYSAQRFLTSSADAQHSYGYGFDGFGLPTAVTADGTTRTLVESDDALTAGSVTYTFDGLRRVVARSDSASPDQALSLSYGADGQIATATRTGVTSTYQHDETGQRLLKTRGSTAVAAFVDEGYLDETGLTEPFQIAGRTVGLVRNGVFTSLATDMRGSVIAETTGEARLASPFGQRDVHPAMAAALDYVEKGWDADLGLVRMGVRDYDPGINQFTTADPLFLEKPDLCLKSPVECNLYGYSRNDPTGQHDPTGKQAVEFNPSGGHHWVPRQVIGELLAAKTITQEAATFLHKQTTGWGKGIDPHQWSGAHVKYTQAVREMAAGYFKGEGNGIQSVKQFLQNVKTSEAAPIRTFADPHVTVVEMVRSGANRQAIQEFWAPIRRSFTSAGSVAGKAVSVFNILGIVSEVGHVMAGDAWIPTAGHEAAWPTIGRWAPSNSFEATSFNSGLCGHGCL